MWIRSQDLFTLIKCERLSVRKCYSENYCVIGDECVVLGEYSTSEKALIVFNEIQDELDSEEFYITDLPDVYEMPQDEDVEV